MKRLSVILALTQADNDYQNQQAASAQEAAQKLNIDLRIMHAENDAANQNQQVLKIIQSSKNPRPDAIMFEPVGTALEQAARLATSCGIGWIVLNREVNYLRELRELNKVPVFSVTTNHVEVGRIQGRQIAAVLPGGGTVLYIQGPSGSGAAIQRTDGMQETKPANVQVRAMKGQWTESSAQQAVNSWLKLSIAKDLGIDVVAAQNDVMAVGAWKALQDLTSGSDRERWSRLPFLGCDGLPGTGQSWVRRGLLTATVIIPPNAGQALEMLADAVRKGIQPPERIFTVPESFPPVTSLTLMN